jgi:hypothetical protein
MQLTGAYHIPAGLPGIFENILKKTNYDDKESMDIVKETS